MPVTISDHALERFMQRVPDGARDLEHARDRLEGWLAASQPASVKPRFRVLQMLNHHPDTEYRMHRGMVFVIMEDLLLTVHMNESERFCYTASLPEDKR